LEAVRLDHLVAKTQVERRDLERSIAKESAMRRQAESEAERQEVLKEVVQQLGACDSEGSIGIGISSAALAEAHDVSIRGNVGIAEHNSDEERAAKKYRGMNWDDCPAELLPKDAVAATEEEACQGAFVEHFKGLGLTEAELAPFSTRQSLEQAETGLFPLLQQLMRNEASPLVIQQLDKMVTFAAEREYTDAGRAYIDVSLGHKKWHNTIASYGGTHGQNKGFRIYTTIRDKHNEYDDSPVVQKYVHSMRKLILFAQCIRPNADMSKHLRT